MRIDSSILYKIFSIFFILFYPRQITHVICFGRHRDEVRINSKIAYCSIYLFWTIFFGILCLMMGAASGIDPTFNKILYFADLTFGHEEYVGAGASEENDDMIFLTYYTKKEIDETILCKIIQDNKFICEPYELGDAEVIQTGKRIWKIQLDGEVLGKIEIERNLVMWKICYIWDKIKLKGRYRSRN
ncbi:MAG: hypothetical protein HDR03_14570 [Lachnospiraceae bacterium]|nr:hypothetical protein [Lachnospiraceae bacterium]